MSRSLERLSRGRLLLVRHGETAWNNRAILQGQEDIALSTAGRRQVIALAPVVARFAPTDALCSDLSRARETAALLGHPQATTSSAWREADLGSWTGRAKVDLEREEGAAYRGWRAGRYDPPGGEGWAALRMRVGGALRALTQDANGGEDGAVRLVVTHGGVIRAACSLLIGVEPDRLVPVDPGSLTVFDLEADGSARLKAFNLGGALPSTEEPSD